MRTALSIISIALVILLASFINPAKKTFTPPDTVPVNDTLYFGDGEISNLQWKEFEKWTEQQYGKNSEAYKKTLPDTTVWRNEVSYNEPYVTYYYQHPAYADFPVVGINYEQAMAFCKWRTEQMEQKMKAGEYHNKVLPKSFYYRLPTKAEWELVANAPNSEKALSAMQSKKGRDV